MTPILITKELLAYMGFKDAEVQERDVEGRVKVSVRVGSARELIGAGGETLAMFQHLVRRIVARHVSPAPMIDIDINNYKQIREGVLQDFAQDVGERVRLERRVVELKPMPSSDRRVIHTALAQFPDLATESRGEGDHRYVVVRPYP